MSTPPITYGRLSYFVQQPIRISYSSQSLNEYGVRLSISLRGCKGIKIRQEMCVLENMQYWCSAVTYQNGIVPQRKQDLSVMNCFQPVSTCFRIRLGMCFGERPTPTDGGMERLFMASDANNIRLGERSVRQECSRERIALSRL